MGPARTLSDLHSYVERKADTAVNPSRLRSPIHYTWNVQSGSRCGKPPASHLLLVSNVACRRNDLCPEIMLAQHRYLPFLRRMHHALDRPMSRRAAEPESSRIKF